MANQFPHNLIRVISDKYAYAAQMFGTLPLGSGGTRYYPVSAGASTPVDVTATSAGSPGTAVQTVYITERLAASYELLTSDALSYQANFQWITTDPNATVRLELYRETRQTLEETLIATYEGTTAKDSTASKDTHTFTIPRNVQLAIGERLILKVWAIPPTGGTFNTGDLRHVFGHSTGGNTGNAQLTCPAGMTWNPARPIFHLHHAASALGGNFKLMDTDGTAQTVQTKATTTTSGGTQIQLTNGAGQAVLEWATARLQEGFTLKASGFTPAGINAAAVYSTIRALESAAGVNAGLRLKCFRRAPTGTETQFMSLDTSAEITTTSATYTISDDNVNSLTTNIVSGLPFSFDEDDRIVCRVYAINKGTMGNGTVTIEYDGGALSTSRLTVQFWDMPGFKSESDPPANPANTGTMTGLQN